MTEEARLARNAKQRERYANDPQYREQMLSRERAWSKTSEGRAKKEARKRRWRAENRERYLAQERRHGQKRRLNPEFRADAITRAKRWRDENPEKHRDIKLRRYGMSGEQYDEMLARQGGVCAICDRPETARHAGTVRALAVDHNHQTGRTRALLCQRCNHTLGRMNDDPQLLRRAADYLEDYA